MSKETKPKSKTIKKKRNMKNIMKKGKEKKNKSITQHVNVNVSSTGGSGGGGSSMPAPMPQQFSHPLVTASKQSQKVGENVDIKNILESINKRLTPQSDYIPPSTIISEPQEDFYTPSDFFRKKDDSNLSLLNQVEQHNNENDIVDLAQHVNEPEILESAKDTNIDADDEGTINMVGGGGGGGMVQEELIFSPKSNKYIKFGGKAHASLIKNGDINLSEEDILKLKQMGLKFSGGTFKKISNEI